MSDSPLRAKAAEVLRRSKMLAVDQLSTSDLTAAVKVNSGTIEITNDTLQKFYTERANMKKLLSSE